MGTDKTELPCSTRKCSHVVTSHSANVPPEKMAKMAIDTGGLFIPEISTYGAADGDRLVAFERACRVLTTGLDPIARHIGYVPTPRGVYLIDTRLSELRIIAATWCSAVQALGVELREVRTPGAGRYVCSKNPCLGLAIVEAEEVQHEVEQRVKGATA